MSKPVPTFVFEAYPLVFLRDDAGMCDRTIAVLRYLRVQNRLGIDGGMWDAYIHHAGAIAVINDHNVVLRVGDGD